MYSIKSRFDIGAKTVLFAGVCVHFSAWKFCRVGGAKGLHPHAAVCVCVKKY